MSREPAERQGMIHRHDAAIDRGHQCDTRNHVIAQAIPHKQPHRADKDNNYGYLIRGHQSDYSKSRAQIVLDPNSSIAPIGAWLLSG